MRNFIVTENHELICAAIDAQSTQIGNYIPIVVISGEYGTGKTESLNYLSAQEGYYLTTCFKGIAHRALLCRIAESMELIPKGTIAELTEQIIQFWEETKIPLMIDEADFIVGGGMIEVARGLADEAKAPLCLSGMGRFENSLKEFPHILDRSPDPDFRVRLKPLNQQGIKRMVEQCSSVKWSLSAMSYLQQRERGRYRGTIWAISKVEKVVKRNGLDEVTDEILEAIL